MLDIDAPLVDSALGLALVIGQTLAVLALSVLFVYGVVGIVAMWNSKRYERRQSQHELRARMDLWKVPEVDLDIEASLYRDFKSEAELDAEGLLKAHTTEML